MGIRSAKKGEDGGDWIGALHTAHGAELCRFLTRLLGDRHTAEDVAQETYVKLYRLVKPDRVVCPRALLFDAATKLAITRLRRAGAEAAVTVSGDTAEAAQVPDDLAQPDRRLAAEQALQRLAQIVEQLPAGLQKVLVMRHVRQMTRAQIAAELNISVGAVEQRLTRALAHCRVRLSALGLGWPTLE